MSIRQVGAEAIAAGYKRELLAFKRAQRAQMRKASQLVRKEWTQQLLSGSPLGVRNSRAERNKSRGSKKQVGPLSRSVALRLFFTAADVVVIIRYRARGFYGRFYETGTAAGKPKSHAVPRRSVREVIFSKIEKKAVELMGEAYGVFK